MEKILKCGIFFTLILITISLGVGNAQAETPMERAAREAKAGGCTCSSTTTTTCTGGACCCPAPARPSGAGTGLRWKMKSLQAELDDIKKKASLISLGNLDHCQTWLVALVGLKNAGVDATILGDVVAAAKACGAQFDRAPQLTDENFRKMLAATAKYGVNISADRRGFLMTPPSRGFLAERTRPYRESLQVAATSEKERREATLNAMLARETQLQGQLDEGVSPAWPWWVAAVAGPAVGVGGGLISHWQGDSPETSAWVGVGSALGTAAVSLAISGIAYHVQKKDVVVRLKVAHDARVAYARAQKPILTVAAPPVPPGL